jgi:hypothetical protein
MIQPLRRRHRQMMAALFVLLVIVAALAIRHPRPSMSADALPEAIVDDAGSARAR